MPKSRQSKVTSVNELTARLKAARGIVFADFTGLVMKELQDLRAEFRKGSISYQVIKKSLLSRSLQDAGLTDIPVKELNGSVSVAVSENDEIEPAKVVTAFAKSHDKLKLLGGVLEGRFVDTEKVRMLSKLPGKQELLGQVVGTLAAPLSGFVNVLQGNVRGLVQVIAALRDKKSA